MSKKLSPLEVLELHVCCYTDEEFEEVLNSVRAEAWDEGHEAGCNRVPHFDNPYLED